jgi:non-heme chloroperoxidase
MPTTLDAAELRNGLRLPYAEQGDPDGTPVVLLHGITDSWRAFEPILPHLPESVHAYAVTARGHGDATRAGSYGLADMVEDVAQFMDAVGLESAIVAGHSMGSIVATRFAIDHPERTAGLVIMGGCTTFARPELDEMITDLAAMSDPLDLDYLRGFQESTLARPISPEYLDLVVSESAKLSAATFRDVWHDTVLTDFAADLGRIAAPTLLVWGERDRLVPPRHASAWLDALPDTRVELVPRAGHVPMVERPEELSRLLREFLGAR